LIPISRDPTKIIPIADKGQKLSHPVKYLPSKAINYILVMWGIM